MAATQVKRKRKKTKQSLVRRYWWLVPALVCVGMIGWLATGPQWSRPRISPPTGRMMPGYIANAQDMSQEYQHFYGKPLSNSEVERWFEQANQRVRANDYSNAVGLLEQVSKVAAVPVVFNNLGVLYAELNDKSRAINAFREALARNMDYRPVRVNLERLKDVMALGADPVSREVESNDSMASANIIATGKAVEGEIDAAINDVDFFRVTTPPAPRDLISIEITNHSKTLAPVLKIFDEETRITNWGKIVQEAGASLHQTIAPPPNTTLYLQVSGYGSSAGAYTLLVQPLKAFDSYEPNDNIFNASRITLGTTIMAGIMDADDTDYYSFVSPRTGTVSILITNRSKTLIPALSTFYPDMRSSGFGPDVRTPGANLRHTMEVQGNQTYFIQVWSQANTAGDYSLVIE
jgi:tetratricopeptide (TPR) repeat protein